MENIPSGRELFCIGYIDISPNKLVT